MEKVIINSYEEFEKLVGQQIGVSDYVELSQERINMLDVYKRQEKDHKSVYAPMRYIQQGVLESSEERKKHRHAPRFAPAGQSTQMIVGATAETDKDILFLSSALYKGPTMRRVYYSGYILSLIHI